MMTGRFTKGGHEPFNASLPCFWLKNWVCFEQKCQTDEKEQRMKTSAFEQWCDQLQMPTATRDFLAHLRASPPARRVQGRLFNVCGTFASRKMGVSIQFESHTVELWAIYTMEYDAQVLEFFDQPHQLELHYQGPSGRPTQALHTPDFLVLRTDEAVHILCRDSLAHVVSLLTRCLGRGRNRGMGHRVEGPGVVTDHIHIRITRDTQMVIDHDCSIPGMLYWQLSNQIRSGNASRPKERSRWN